MSRFSSASFRPIELLINRGIRLSSTAQAMTRALEGKSLDVRLQDTPLALRLAARDGKIEVSTPGELPATALLAGTPLAMIRLLAGDPQALIREGEVRISGDTDVANQFRDLLHMARPDLEEELSKLVGDPLAHELGNMAREMIDWGERTARSVARSFGEYLTEERRTLPAAAEVAEFYRDVDRTANDVERAATRLALLRERLKDRAP